MEKRLDVCDVDEKPLVDQLEVNLCQTTANSLARCGTAPPTGHSGLSRTMVFYGFLLPEIRA